ncbi:ImmA/IrrE family metallo-endopeptidase [Candidatus Hydrogenedentota bacterium]
MPDDLDFDIKSIMYSDEVIRDKADEFRGEYWQEDTLPIDIELIAERMGLDLIPVAHLKQQCDMVASVVPNCKEMYIDLETWNAPNQEPFLRFSVAHEIAHVILHAPLLEWFASQNLPSIREWGQMVQQQSQEPRIVLLEKAAHEFAGRVLVPIQKLEDAFNAALVKCEGVDMSEWNPDTVRAYLANDIYRDFGVSRQALEIRLRKERFWSNHRKS